MAPPKHPFPVSELTSHVPTKISKFKDTSRKLPRNFDLQECELHEVVQYSCTTTRAQVEHRQKNPGAPPLDRHCYPFVRLFRKCQEGGIGGKHRVFHVETTAWEGKHRWVPKEKKEGVEVKPEGEVGKEDVFAKYGSYFWSNR